MVRAKFLCTQKAVNVSFKGGAEYASIKFQPVMGGSDENKLFWTYTPSGNLDMSVVNKEAADKFEVGKEYYVDFTQAD
jgi:hypothetical protein